jgi:hypothetical protein
MRHPKYFWHSDLEARLLSIILHFFCIKLGITSKSSNSNIFTAAKPEGQEMHDDV